MKAWVCSKCIRKVGIGCWIPVNILDESKMKQMPCSIKKFKQYELNKLKVVK